MLAPLMILALLSIVGGWLAAPAFLPGGTDYFAKFPAACFSAAWKWLQRRPVRVSLELWLAGVAVVTAFVGAMVA